MIFVNTMIVHNTCSANKNVGDAFLLVWKIPLSLEDDTLTSVR